MVLVAVVYGQGPIGSFLTNVGDLFGYDVFRRPRIVIAIPAAPAPPAAAPAPGAPPRAPGAPGLAPAAPAPRAGAPAVPQAPPLLTDSVRRGFSVNLNWDRSSSPGQPNNVVPPIVVSPRIAPAGTAPAAASAPAPVAPQAPPARNADRTIVPARVILYHNKAESRQNDYEDSPRRLNIELPDYENEEERSDADDAKEKFKREFNNFWELSPWTPELGYKFLAPDKERISEQPKIENSLKVTHRVQIRQDPSKREIDELAAAPSTPVTFYQPQPAAYEHHPQHAVPPNVDPTAWHWHIVNQEIQDYYAKKFAADAEAQRELAERMAAMGMKRGPTNADILQYYSQKFHADALEKQRIANQGQHLLDDPSAYIAPLQKQNTVAQQNYNDPLGPVVLTIQEYPQNTYPASDIYSIDFPATSPLIPEDQQRLVIQQETPGNAPILKDIAINPHHIEIQVPRAEGLVKLLNQEKPQYNEKIQENHEDVSQKQAENEEINNNEDQREEEVEDDDDNDKQIIDSNHRENFEVENIGESDAEEDAPENEKQDESAEEQNEESEKQENTEDAEEGAGKNKSTESELEREEGHGKQNENEESGGETVNKLNLESEDQNEANDGRQQNAENNEEVRQQNEKESGDKSKVVKDNEKINLQDIEKFIKTHFGDRPENSYERIRGDIQGHVGVSEDVKDDENGESRHESYDRSENEENSADSAEKEEIEDEKADVEREEEDEKEDIENDENEKEDVETEENEKESVDDEENESSSSVQNEDKAETDPKEEEQERLKIKELEKLHEKEFYNIFPKLGEGSKFESFFNDFEGDRKSKDSKNDAEKLAQPTIIDLFQSFGEITEVPKSEKSKLKSKSQGEGYKSTKLDHTSDFSPEFGKYKSNKNSIEDATQTKKFNAKDSFLDKANHEDTEKTVIQPLFSGVLHVGNLKELYQSEKPVTVPFDYDYSASERKEKRTKREAEYLLEKFASFIKKNPDEPVGYVFDDAPKAHVKDENEEEQEEKKAAPTDIQEFIDKETAKYLQDTPYIIKTIERAQDFEGFEDSGINGESSDNKIEVAGNEHRETETSEKKGDKEQDEKYLLDTPYIVKAIEKSKDFEGFEDSEENKEEPNREAEATEDEKQESKASEKKERNEEIFNKDDFSRFVHETPEIIKAYESNREYIPDEGYGTLDEALIPAASKEHEIVKATKKVKYADIDDEEFAKFIEDRPDVIKEYEQDNTYVPAAYDQEFNYEAPEPKQPDYEKLERKTHKEDFKLSPNAQITSKQSGKSDTFIKIHTPTTVIH